MGVYRSICYKVEDVIVKLITKKQEQEQVTQKVEIYRMQKEAEKASKKKENVRNKKEVS